MGGREAGGKKRDKFMISELLTTMAVRDFNKRYLYNSLLCMCIVTLLYVE